MNEIWVHMIVGQFEEPFLEAALRSVEWADGFSVVNTDPTGLHGQRNETIVRRTVPREKLHLSHVWMSTMDFAKARNASLDMIPDGAYVLLVDADDVHWPHTEMVARREIAVGHDIVTGHFNHLAVYKNLVRSIPHREILFLKTPEVRFQKGVHEALSHPRSSPVLASDWWWCHYGYIKSPREVFKRWKLYSAIEGDYGHYAGQNPDDTLVGWAEECQPFWREHPPAVRKVLEAYPEAPRSARALPEGTPCNVGLVLLTWDDAENLKACLASLAGTRQPFNLLVVDNGSTDGSVDLINRWADESRPDGCLCEHSVRPGLSLAQALNYGFGVHMRDPEIDYIGWIHPDMIFEKDTWLECLRSALDCHPDVVKAGAFELGPVPYAEPTPGNSQCFLIRKSALEKIGLYDEGFVGCGGHEDWDMNARLLKIGKVMIWPEAQIRHIGMATRSRRDTDPEARANAHYYFSKYRTWNAPV